MSLFRPHDPVPLAQLGPLGCDMMPESPLPYTILGLINNSVWGINFSKKKNYSTNPFVPQ